MYRLEVKALNTFVDPPRIWWRFVDDIEAVMKSRLFEKFLDHLNSLHPRIKFTIERSKNKELPFLDTKVKIQEDGKVTLEVYRKPTHTDQYLAFDSNHHMSQKLGIVHTLQRRKDRIVTTEEDKQKEDRQIKQALARCGYPKWAVEKEKTVKSQEQKKKTKERGEYDACLLYTSPSPRD